MPKVLIPYDGSNSAKRAVRHVASLAAIMKPIDAVLLDVQHPLPLKQRIFDGRASDVHALEVPLRKAAEKRLAAAGKVLGKAGIGHAGHVEFGEPAQVIADYAKTYHCDMIVMGTRDLGTVKSLILGSVATRVLHVATVPVMLIK